MVGKSISHYRILEKLGEGGMGVVYKAEDTKLDRPVALKFLPAHLLGNEDVRKRFEREAKSAAALDHPNVCHVYQIDEADGHTFISMSLIEGESLDRNIARGPLKLDEALSIAQQVAKGLEAAHKRGVIHRDIKPENIMVGEDGHVTIMDFGLAQLTEASRLTRTDETLGTVAYMSPEQTEGSGTDHRTDIWSLGVVLYEMITGQQPFRGDYDKAVMYSILNEQPEPPSALRTGVPHDLEFIISKCLAKERAQRYQHAEDLAVDLANAERGLQSRRSEVQAIPSAAAPRLSGRSSTKKLNWRSVALAALAASICTAIATLALTASRDSRSSAVTHLSMEVDPLEVIGTWRVENATLARSGGELTRTAFGLSPDGRRLVIAGRSAEHEGLFLRDLSEPSAKFIPGTDGAMSPFLSPDGKWVGFWADGRISKVRLDGGPAAPLCDADLLFGAHWGSTGQIVFGQRTGGLLAVSDEGGVPVQLTLAEGESGGERHLLPWALPDGESLLFTIFNAWKGGGWDDAEIVVESLESGERKTLIVGGSQPVVLPTGHLVYAKGGSLWAAPFDDSALELTGPPTLVVDGVTQAAGISNVNKNSGAAQFTVSANGTLAYLDGGLLPPEQRRLVWVDPSGVQEMIDLPPGEYWHPRISPDGARIAVSDQFANQVLVYNLRRKVFQRLQGGGMNVGTWSPDGRRIVFGWAEGGARNLFWQLADGRERPQRLTTSPNLQFAGPWPQDGSGLIFTEWRQDTRKDIMRLEPVQPGAVPEPLMTETFNEEYPALSPDGAKLAYASDESGQHEVYIRSYPGLEDKEIASQDGGYAPAWSADGSTLFYVKPIGSALAELAVMAVELEAERRGPRELFRGPYHFGGVLRTYDVAADGRLLMVARSEETGNGQGDRSLRVVLNWFEELEHLAR